MTSVTSMPFTFKSRLVMGTNPLMARMRVRLAGTGQPDDHDEFALVDLDAEIPHGRHATRIRDRCVLEANHGAPRET